MHLGWRSKLHYLTVRTDSQTNGLWRATCFTEGDDTARALPFHARQVVGSWFVRAIAVSFGGIAHTNRQAYSDQMATENRKVAAETAAHAQGLTDNLTKQGFALETQSTGEWVLRKKRHRGDRVVTIVISQPSMIQQPSPVTPPSSNNQASNNQASNNWPPPQV
jgi:hypothetical protein